jgi:hypothetical protein
VNAADRERDTEHRAGRREHAGLAEESSHQPAAMRTERRPHRQLVRPALRADEKQIRDVGAGHDEQQPDGDRDNPQRAREIADHRVAHRPHDRGGLGLCEQLSGRERRKEIRKRFRQSW